MNKNTYEPETLEEEFAFFGRESSGTRSRNEQG